MDQGIAQWGLIADQMLFGISAFRGLQSQKTRLAYIVESRNVKRSLVVWPVVITDDHMEVEKGRASLH